MNTTIVSYYITELNEWDEDIERHLLEIDDASEWLKEVLQHNTVPKLAAKVEHHLTQLFLSRQKLEGLVTRIESLERSLYEDNVPINVDGITPVIKEIQNKLRKDIYQVEIEFLDVKYNCNEFLGEAMNIQNN